MRRILPLLLALVAAPAWAQDADGPRFCPNRPSLGESACTTEPGHIQFELSAIDWERDDQPDQRQDTIRSGDLQARFGLSATNELQVGWTPLGHVRTRDRATGLIDTANRVGDVRLALRQNLRNPDGKGLSYGIEPFVTLPVGRMPVGAGTWGAGGVIPVTYDVSDTVNVQFTGDAEAQPDEDGNGRHLAFGAIWGVGFDVSDSVTAVAELSLRRDDDPEEHVTEAVLAGSLAWQPTKVTQLDVLVGTGLNHDTPDVRIVTGGAIVF